MHRRRRATFWIRWAVRDARRHRLQVLSIALLLALGVGMYAAMSSMSTWRVDSADASFAELRMHDLRFSLVEGGTAAQGDLRAALAASGAGGEVAAAAERLVVPTQVDASGSGRTVIVPGRIVGTPAGSDVDTLSTRAGRPPAGGTVALEHNFARHYDLPATGAVTLAGGRRVRYSGQALAPEYFIVTAPGADFGAEAAFAVVFAPLRTAQEETGRPGRVNELVVRLRPGADRGAIRTRVAAALRERLAGTGFAVTERDDEPAHRLIYNDAEGDQEMLDIFAWLLLGAATFAAFNLISRVVEAQRREIGIGMALGVEPRILARRPFLLGAQIALGGVALGIPSGSPRTPGWRASWTSSSRSRSSGRSSRRRSTSRERRWASRCPSWRRRSRCGGRCASRRSRRSASARERRAAAGSPGSPRGSGCPAGASATSRCATSCGRRAGL